MKRGIVLWLVLAACLPLAAKVPAPVFAYSRSAERIGDAGETAAVPLDAAFYRELDADYGNLRIFDANGKTVPFAVRIARPLVKDVSYARLKGKVTAFSVDENANSAVIEYALDKPADLARLEFPSSARRFSKTLSLTVWDGQGRILREIAELPFFRRDRLVGGSTADFAPVRGAARFRVVIRPYRERQIGEYATETEGPDGRTVTSRVRREAFDPRDVIPYRAVERRFRNGEAEKTVFVLPETARQEKDGRTVITVDASRIPCRELEVQTSDPHFRRAVEVYARETNGTFMLIARRVVQPENPVVPLPEQRSAVYRVEIGNGDDAPLHDLRLVWRAAKRLLIFVPPAGNAVVIRYGGAAPKPRYDIEDYADDFVTRTECYALGQPIRSPAGIPWYRRLGASRSVMAGTLILTGAMLLGIILVILFRKPQGGGEAE